MDRHASGIIGVKLSATLQTVVVTVDDDGAPVPVSEREKIFGRFVRLDESRSRQQGGSGLGLAITRSIIEAHRGRVTATETSQGWCRFEIKLPTSARPAGWPPTAYTHHNSIRG